MDESQAKNWFTDHLNVSRETMERLEVYNKLLQKWNRSINLVSKTTLQDPWRRHFVDSAQLYDFRAESSGNWTDLGSGAGFPGIVLAILHAGECKTTKFHVYESDQRKCSFMRTVLRETGTTADIHTARIENAEPIKASVVSSRALAPLNKLLGFASPFLAHDGKCLFLKGRGCDSEIEEARKDWNFDLREEQSVTASDAVILEISGIDSAKQI